MCSEKVEILAPWWVSISYLLIFWWLILLSFQGKMGKLLLSVFWESWNSNTTMNFTLPSVWFLNDWLIDFSLFLLITSKLLTYYYGKVKNRKWKRSEQMIQGLNGFKKKLKVFLVECFILLRNYLTLFCETEAEMTAVSDVTQSFILLKL